MKEYLLAVYDEPLPAIPSGLGYGRLATAILNCDAAGSLVCPHSRADEVARGNPTNPTVLYMVQGYRNPCVVLILGTRRIVSTIEHEIFNPNVLQRWIRLHLRHGSSAVLLLECRSDRGVELNLAARNVHARNHPVPHQVVRAGLPVQALVGKRARQAAHPNRADPLPRAGSADNDVIPNAQA